MPILKRWRDTTGDSRRPSAIGTLLLQSWEELEDEQKMSRCMALAVDVYHCSAAAVRGGVQLVVSLTDLESRTRDSIRFSLYSVGTKYLVRNCK